MADNQRLDALRRRVQRDPASIAFAQLAEELRRELRLTTVLWSGHMPDDAYLDDPMGIVDFVERNAAPGSIWLAHSDGTWTESVLYSFKGGTDGASPISSLVADAKGNLYGTTSDGGAPSCSCGVIFKMVRGASGSWTESVAYRFPGTPGPGFAYNGLVRDPAGNLYGATVHGGSSNNGAIYEFTP